MTCLRTLAAALVLALPGLAACGPAPESEGVMLSQQEVMARPPLWEAPGPVKIWAAERASDMGVYYVLSGRETVGPVRHERVSVRIVLLKGRARLQSGAEEKIAGSGAYAVAPPGAAWSLKRLGREPLVFSLLVSPDSLAPSELLQGVAGAPR